MNRTQVMSLVRHGITAAGSIAAVVAAFDPQWGATLDTGIEAFGGIAAGLATIWGIFSPMKQAVGGLTGDEATAVLNNASLLKSQGKGFLP